MVFSYQLLEPGWARAEFRAGLKTMVYEPAYINDPYGDILRSVCTFLSEKERNTKETEIIWNIAPLRVTISMKYFGDTIQLIITEVDENEPVPKKTKIIDERINTKDFLHDLIESGRKMLCSHGIAGYRASSINYEFPLSAYLSLLKKRECSVCGEAADRTENVSCVSQELRILFSALGEATENA